MGRGESPSQSQMAEVKWIKIVTDIFDNRKIKLIRKMPEGNAIIVTWIQLLCLAGETNDNGLIYITKAIPYTEETLASAFDTPVQIVRLAIETFQRLEMVVICNSFFCVANWDKYQNIDALEKIRQQTRARVAQHREKQKALSSCNVTVTLPVTQCNATEEDKEEDKDKETEKRTRDNASRRFSPPTVDEVTAYCQERGNTINAETFIDFYTMKGWKVGKESMKDWKAAVRTWEKRDGCGPKPATPSKPKRYKIIVENGKEVSVLDE